MNAIGQHCDLVYCVMSHFGKRIRIIDHFEGRNDIFSRVQVR